MLILLNTLFLAMDHYNISDGFSRVLDIANKIFTILFACEMTVKMFGLGIRRYVRDGFNIFDAIVVIFGLLDFFKLGSSAITVFRCFRIVRIFKIVRSWTGL